MKHIIAVLLENEPGALSRVVGLFSARGYNIESLTVAPTEDASLSRMTIQTTGSDDVIEQITKHLNRLIEVVKVVDLTEGAYTERELMLIKVRAVGKEREEMKRMADIFRGRIIDVTDKSYTIELTGDSASVEWTNSAVRASNAAGSRTFLPQPESRRAAAHATGNANLMLSVYQPAQRPFASFTRLSRDVEYNSYSLPGSARENSSVNSSGPVNV